MSDAILQIKVGADVKDAIAGLGQVADEAKSTGTALTTIPTAADKAAKGISGIIKPSQDAIITIGNLKDKLKELKTQLDSATSGTQIQDISIKIKGIEDALKEAVTVGVNPAHESFEKLRVAFEDVNRISTGTSFGIRGMAQNFYLIGPAATIAIAAIAFLIEKFKDLKAPVDQSNDILSEAGKDFSKAAAEVYTLQENVKLAKDGFIDKNTVVKEYNDTIGRTIGQVTSLDQVEQKLAKNADAYIKFTLLKAAAQVAYGKAADAAFQAALVAQKKADEFKNPVVDIRVAQQGTFNAADYDAETKRIAAAQQKRKDEEIKSANDAKQKLIDIGKDFEKQAAEISKKSKFHFDPVKITSGGTKGPDTLKATELALQEITKLQDELAKVDKRPLFERFADSINTNQGEALKTKIALVIRDNAKNGIKESITNEEVSLLNQQLQKLFNPNILSKVTVNLEPEIKAEDVSRSLEKQFSKLDEKVYIHLNIAGFNQDEVKKREAELAKIAEQFGKSFQGIVENTINNAATAIGEAIGGGGLDSLLDGLANVLSGALRAIGQLYVKTGVEVLVAKGVFEKFLIANPVLSIAAGVGLEIFAGILKSSVSKTKAFAEGGIVTGPTLGLVGEAGPEVIFPLDRLNQFVRNTQGSGTMQVAFSGRLDGNNIRLSQTRTANQQRMV